MKCAWLCLVDYVMLIFYVVVRPEQATWCSQHAEETAVGSIVFFAPSRCVCVRFHAGRARDYLFVGSFRAISMAAVSCIVGGVAAIFVPNPLAAVVVERDYVRFF